MKRDSAIIRAHDLETVSDGADRMGVSPSWIYQLINRNKLDYYEVAGRKLIHRRDVDSLIRNRAS